MESRRNVLLKMVAGAATAAIAPPAVAVAATEPEHVVSGATLNEGEAPWWLLAPMVAGSRLAAGWTIRSLSPVNRGASVLEIQHDTGRAARVHVCGHDGQPRGLAHTALVDLVLMDGGDGDLPTDEVLGRVLLGLAAHVRSNELSPDGDLRPIARMMTHGHRVVRYGAETLG